MKMKNNNRILSAVIGTLALFVSCDIYAATGASNFRGTAVSTSAIKWEWDIGTLDLDGYYLKDDDGNSKSAILTPATSIYIETGFDSNTLYRRHIRSVQGATTWDTNSFSAYTLVNIPFGLYLISKTSASITMGWYCQDDLKSTFYGVERSSSSYGAWGYVVTLSSSLPLTRYTDPGLGIKTTYYYRVSAYNGDGTASTPSASQPFVTMSSHCVSPQEMAVTKTESRTVYLKWYNYNGDYVWLSGYDIYRSTDGVVFNKLNSSFITKDIPGYQVYVDSNILVSWPIPPTLYYKVLPYNTDNEAGSFSATVTASLTIKDYYWDIDGDGALESINDSQGTYTDSGTGSKLIAFADLLGNGYNYDALIDTNNDGVVDTIWLPKQGRVTKNLSVEDVDGDGAADIMYDSSGDNIYDRYYTLTRSIPLGKVQGKVLAQQDTPVSSATVTCAMSGGTVIVYTDGNGEFEFILKPLKGVAAALSIEKTGHIPYSQSVTFAQGETNSINITMLSHGLTPEIKTAHAYPNPVKYGSTTKIVFEQAAEGERELVLFDTSWRQIVILSKEYGQKEVKEIVWDLKDSQGTAVNPGLYYYVLRTPGNERKIGKIVIKP